MNFNQEKPIFQQIAEMIENQILDGLLNADEQTPSSNDFSNIYGINPATARKGFSLLTDEGVLYKKRGMGMFVTNEAKEIIMEKRRNEFYTNRLPEIIKEIRRLNIPLDKLSELLKESAEEV